MSEDIYVIVSDNDIPHPKYGKDEGGPLVFEQYTRSADLESIRVRAKTMSTHGKCRIAKLVFVE